MKDCTNGLISLIVPVLNENGNVELLFSKIQDALSGENFEIIFIDDGSTDGTSDKLVLLSKQNKNVRYIILSRNWGHQSALKAGLDHAVGDCVISLDGDMQHPPELIPKMIELWRQGADAVHSIREEEKKQSKIKKKTSGLFYTVFNAMCEVTINPSTADFRLLDRKIVDICKDLHEDNFFWRGIIPWLGFKQEYLQYTPNERASGHSKYSLFKMLKLAWSGISSFSILPLRFATFLGGILLLFSMCYSVFSVAQYFLGATIKGWTSLTIVTLLVGSIQLILLGVIGEYVGKIHLAVKKRPAYLVKEMHENLIKAKD